MVPLLLRKLAYTVYKLERSAKVANLKSLRDVVFFDDVPSIDLLLKYGEILALERRHASTARNAFLGRKVGHSKSYSTPPARHSVHFIVSAPEFFGMRKEGRLVKPNRLGCTLNKTAFA